MLKALRSFLSDDAAYSGRSGQRDGADVGVLNHRRAHLAAKAGDDIDHASRNSAIGQCLYFAVTLAAGAAVFLALGARSRYRFGVASLGGDREAAERGVRWLQGALTELGVGAKSAAGYGYWELEPPAVGD